MPSFAQCDTKSHSPKQPPNWSGHFSPRAVATTEFRPHFDCQENGMGFLSWQSRLPSAAKVAQIGSKGYIQR